MQLKGGDMKRTSRDTALLKGEDNSAAIKASERSRYWNDPAGQLAKCAAERTRYRRGHRSRLPKASRPVSRPDRLETWPDLSGRTHGMSGRTTPPHCANTCIQYMTYFYMYRSSLLLVQNSNINVIVKMIWMEQCPAKSPL